MVITLKATARTAEENLTNIRKGGSVPAVVYGAGRETASISVPLKEFKQVLKEAGESGTIVLELPNGKATVLVHDLVNHPVTGVPEHVDFLAIDVTKPIEVNLPIEFTGIAPAEKNALGVLVKAMHELPVKGLSKDIPHSIVVDLGSLAELGSHIAVKDISLPSGVTAMADETAIVANISSIKEEKEEVTAIDFESIEVTQKGKKEEEAPATE
jgi:large subunit ribosomal protein L25